MAIRKKKNGTQTNDVGTDLVPLEGNLPANVTKEEFLQMYKDDLDATIEGVIPRLPQIKILHGETQMFLMPPDENSEEPKVDSFEGIIIDQHPCNAWWEKSFKETGGGQLPDCSSLDGVHGIRDGGDIVECLTCEHNQWGSGRDDAGTPTRGKACKNMKRLHILIHGDDLPYRLTLPPSSIEEVDTFLTTLRRRKIALVSAKLRFSLVQETNRDGFKYSEIRFEFLGQIPIAEYMKIKEFLRLHKARIRGQEILAEEYESDQNGEKEETPEGDSDDLPF